MPQNKPLTFEEFIKRDPLLRGHPRYDNFTGYFTTSGWAALARETPHSIRFQQEHSALDELLCNGIMNRDRTIEVEKAMVPLEPYLYQAYLFMREYGVSDEDLLIAGK